MRIFSVIGVSLLLTASGLQGQTPSDPGAIQILRSGSQPSRDARAEHFTGTARVDPLFRATAPARASGALVTFEPGARTAWHSHPLGQIPIVTAGIHLNETPAESDTTRVNSVRIQVLDIKALNAFLAKNREH